MRGRDGQRKIRVDLSHIPSTVAKFISQMSDARCVDAAPRPHCGIAMEDSWIASKNSMTVEKRHGFQSGYVMATTPGMWYPSIGR